MAVFMTAWFFYGSLWILRSLILVNCEGEPKFRFKPKRNYVASVGGSVRLACPVSGTNDAKDNRTLVAWFKNGSLIRNSFPEWSRFSLKKDKHLKIVAVKKEDAGTYLCNAGNPHGFLKLHVVLKVEASKKTERAKPPKFKQFFKMRKMYRTGETAKLQCHSSGNPDPNVGWFKNGNPYGVHERASVTADGWTLNLRYLNIDDTGNYTCRVSNKVGSIKRTFVVVVKARTLRPIIEDPDVVRRTTREGRSVKLDCKVTSVGQVIFNWRWSERNSNKTVDLKASHRFGSKYIGNYTKTRVVSMNRFYFDGFLVIKDVRKQDEGMYTCMVENSYGKDEVNFHLRVRGKRDKTLVPTTPNPTVTLATKSKLRTTEETISVMFIAVLTVAILVIMIFIVVLIMCCRKQRKDLEKQYVNEYQPQNLYQPYAQQISVTQEMQKSENDYSVLNMNENEREFVKPCASLQSSQISLKDSKRAPSSSSEMYLANSRTSLQTTLCRTCPRDTSFDCNGSTNHSLPRRTESSPGVQFEISHGLPLSASTMDRNADRQKWESKTSLDDSPKNTSPQRSRESIV